MNKSKNIFVGHLSGILLILMLAAIGISGQDKKARADSLLNEAIQLSAQQTAEAQKSTIEKLIEARKLFQEIDLKSAEALCLFMLGQIHQIRGEKEKAIDYYQESLSIHRLLGNQAGEANTLAMLGLIYNAAGDKKKALEVNEQAILIFQNLGDKKSEVITTTTVCLLYYGLNEKQKSLNCHHRMLPLYRQFGDKWGEGLTLNSIGGIYNDFGKTQNALEKFTEALAVRQSIGDKRGEQITLNNLGAVYDNLGDKPKALVYYRQSLSLAKLFGDKIGEAKTLGNLGKVFKDLGEIQKALEYHHQALTIYRLARDQIGEAKTLNNIGETYLETGELAKAFDFENQALTIFRAISDKQPEAIILLNIGGIYAQLGEHQKALEFSNAALPIFRATNDQRGEANALNSIGTIYLSREEHQKALDYFLQALPLRQKTNDKLGEATTFGNLGSTYLAINDLTKSIDYFIKALTLEIAIKDKRGEATTLNNIGDVYARFGEGRKALEQFNKALLLSKAVNDKRGEAITLSNLMLTWNGLGNRRQAIFFGKQSANRFQELRNSAQKFDQQSQKIFLKSVASTYRNLTEFLLFEKRLPEAQHTLIAFKDQQFFDFDQSQKKSATLLALTLREKEFSLHYEKTSEQVGTLSGQIEELKRKIGTRQPTADETAQIQKLEVDLKTATDAFLAVLKQAETEFSKSPDEKDKIKDGEILDLSLMKTALQTLNQQTKQKTVAVYLLVGEDNFRALIVSPDGIKDVFTLIKGTELNQKALKLWGLLQSPAFDTTVLSKQIYDVVFKPIEAELPKDTKTIMWSLDENLHYIPMAALWDGKQFLAERFNHVIFTRADAERMTRNVNPNWTGTGFGTSEAKTVELYGNKIPFLALPGVTEELQSIFRPDEKGKVIVTGNILSDAQFTKDKFYQSLEKPLPLVHISSHFSFRPGDESRSFLLMGDGSALTLNELKQKNDLFKGVDLLTLSACNTAATQADANGREIDGFAELAQRLGAGAVMATLWQVSDASTPWLMREFYANRQGNNDKVGMNKAEALQKAQISLLQGTAEVKPLPNVTKSESQNQVQIVIVPKGTNRDGTQTRSDVIYLDESQAPNYKSEGKPKYAHPFYWSPFVLYGNWR